MRADATHSARGRVRARVACPVKVVATAEVAAHSAVRLKSLKLGISGLRLYPPCPPPILHVGLIALWQTGRRHQYSVPPFDVMSASSDAPRSMTTITLSITGEVALHDRPLQPHTTTRRMLQRNNSRISTACRAILYTLCVSRRCRWDQHDISAPV